MADAERWAFLPATELLISDDFHRRIERPAIQLAEDGLLGE
jgi:hypothetical protein